MTEHTHVPSCTGKESEGRGQGKLSPKLPKERSISWRLQERHCRHFRCLIPRQCENRKTPIKMEKSHWHSQVLCVHPPAQLPSILGDTPVCSPSGRPQAGFAGLGARESAFLKWVTCKGRPHHSTPRICLGAAALSEEGGQISRGRVWQVWKQKILSIWLISLLL